MSSCEKLHHKYVLRCIAAHCDKRLPSRYTGGDCSFRDSKVEGLLTHTTLCSECRGPICDATVCHQHEHWPQGDSGKGVCKMCCPTKGIFCFLCEKHSPLDELELQTNKWNPQLIHKQGFGCKKNLRQIRKRKCKHRQKSDQKRKAESYLCTEKSTKPAKLK
jgi:hypothetical protein